MAIDDGGNVFPHAIKSFADYQSMCPGMSMLDYFAGLAMQGMLAQGEDWEAQGNWPFLASSSYGIAVEMLAEKKRRMAND